MVWEDEAGIRHRDGLEPWGKVLGRGTACQASSSPHCRPIVHIRPPRNTQGIGNSSNFAVQPGKLRPGAKVGPPELSLLSHQLTLVINPPRLSH